MRQITVPHMAYKQQQPKNIHLTSEMSQEQAQITAENYELVLKYMQTANVQNYEEAVNMMKACDFNLQQAVQMKLGMGEEEANNNSGFGNRTRNFGEEEEEVRERNSLRVQEDIRKYIQFTREKNKKSIFVGIFNFTKNLVTSIFCGLTELILPEFILKKILRSNFYNLYHTRILPNLRDRSLSCQLKQSPNSRKAIFFIISSPTAHESIIGLLNNAQIAKKIDESFILTGSLVSEKQCKIIEGDKQTPMIVVCRMSVFQKIQIVKKFVGEQEIREITTQKLNYVIREHQRLARRDRNLLIRYRNYLRRTYYGNRPGYLEQEEEEELYHVERMTTHTNLIHEQNKEYKKVQEQTRRKQSLELLEKQKQQEQKKKFSQIQQQRKVRKMSIPDEPHTGDFVRINFRCPDGSTKIRNFESNEKLELVYAWVETNEEIQFEDDKARNFQLMHGFPPSSLSDRKDKLLKDVFESDQEKIIIREI